MKKGIFPGWLIVIGSFMIMATCYAIFVNCLNLFLVPVTNDLGLTRAQFNANSSIAAVVGVFSSIFLGKIVGSKSARLFGVISVLIAGVNLFCWAFVTELWQMYVLSVLIGFSVISGTRLLISILISNWFDKKRGLAISIALSGSGVGGMIMSQIASNMIATHGWRQTFIVLAVITLIFSLPLTITVFRNKPSDIGLKPYGADENSESVHTNNQTVKVKGMDASKVVRSGAFWALMLGFLGMGLINGGVIINIAANFTDAGHSAEFAANMITLNMFILIIGKLTMGVVFDRFGTVAGSLLGCIATMIATSSMLFADTMIGPLLFAFSFGFGSCLGTIAPSILVIEEFGKKDMGSLVGYVTAFQMFGGAIGSILTGIIFDVTGSYKVGWVILSITGLVMTVALLSSIVMSKRLIEKVKVQESDIITSNVIE